MQEKNIKQQYAELAECIEYLPTVEAKIQSYFIENIIKDIRRLGDEYERLNEINNALIFTPLLIHSEQHLKNNEKTLAIYKLNDILEIVNHLIEYSPDNELPLALHHLSDYIYGEIDALKH